MYNADEIAALLKVLGSVPDGRFQDSDLLSFAYLPLISDIVPTFIKARREYFLTVSLQDVVLNQSEYRIPSEAFLGLIRAIAFVDANGSETQLEMIDESDAENQNQSGVPEKFFIRAGSIVLSRKSSVGAGSLKLTHWLLPPKIVPLDECAEVSSIAGTTINFVSMPTTFVGGLRFDVIRGTSDYEPFSRGIVSVTPGSNTMDFSAAVSTEIRAGDYVALSGKSPFPYLDSALFPALLQFALAHTFFSLGKFDQQAACEGRARELLKTADDLLSHRVQNYGQPIISPLI